MINANYMINVACKFVKLNLVSDSVIRLSFVMFLWEGYLKDVSSILP